MTWPPPTGPSRSLDHRKAHRYEFHPYSPVRRDRFNGYRLGMLVAMWYLGKDHWWVQHVKETSEP